MPQRAEPNLFAEFDPVEATPAPGLAPAGDPAVRRAGPFAGVAMEQAIDRILTYAVPKPLIGRVRVGQRVRAPLGRGNRAAFGYVVRLDDTTDFPRVKPLLGIDDQRVLLDARLLELAMWVARYYVCPLGAVIESIIPSAVRKKVGVTYVWLVRLALSRDEAQRTLEQLKAKKRRAVLARLLQAKEGEAVELVRLAGEAGVTPATVRNLRSTGWITLEQAADIPGFATDVVVSQANEPPLDLNEDQQRAFDTLRARLFGGFSVNLLMGVTGSGKTEIYLRCIAEVIAAGKQALVLVPEIALTPQTVARFRRRFGRVAVMHSGLSASRRHRFWQQVSRGDVDVVVGARSAIFAPAPRLGIIVVDEEHESSYKQDSAPRYHARDVAIKRAQLERIPVLLGSATPALETYHRATASPGAAATIASSLLILPNRVRGLQLASIELVDMRGERRIRRGRHLFSQRLETLLRNTLDTGRQAILLLNRRGYANYVHCPSCGHVMQCRFCDTTMTYHRTLGAEVHDARFEHGLHTGQLHCHYCLAVNPLPEKCPDCGKQLSLFGLGTQRVEEELEKKFPGVAYDRVDSDTMRSARHYEQALARFGRGETRVLLGTQMIAKGLDFPNVTLVGVISGDTALSLPDFRASERTFQLITQVAGRAGRGDVAGRVVLQTFMPDDPTIRLAMNQDYPTFATQEMRARKEVGLPPFTRMARIILRDQDLAKLAARADALAQRLSAATATHGTAVSVKGPMPCAIARIAGYFRHQVIISSASAARVQDVLTRLRLGGELARGERVAVDVDPVSLL